MINKSDFPTDASAVTINALIGDRNFLCTRAAIDSVGARNKAAERARDSRGSPERDRDLRGTQRVPVCSRVVAADIPRLLFSKRNT